MWDTRIKGRPRRGDCLHVIWKLGDAPLATLRVRVVVHILSTRTTRLWCKPSSPSDESLLRDLLHVHPDLGAVVSQVWVVPRERT